jgi:hypothetical protein
MGAVDWRLGGGWGAISSGAEAQPEEVVIAWHQIRPHQRLLHSSHKSSIISFPQLE